MHKFTVGALFKNEAHCLREWIEHYLFHGADHFWLINDGSTDNFLEVLEPYLRLGLVTLFESKIDMYLGRQRDLYNHYFLPRLKETQWLLIVDLDEFMWSPRSVNITDVLASSRHLGQIQVRVTIFGSNGLVKQPASLVAGFTRRSKDRPTDAPRCMKYFVNSNFQFKSLNVHHADFEREEMLREHTILVYPEFFTLNHYSCQSREFWDTVKLRRGDADNYLKRSETDWEYLNQNDVEDFDLYNQNRPLLMRLGFI